MKIIDKNVIKEENMEAHKREEQMKIQAELAKTTFERQERLWKQKVGSEMQFLQAKTNYEAQEKAVKQIEEQIAKTVITAPFSGVIDEIITKQGNMVSPGMSQLFRVVNLKEIGK